MMRERMDGVKKSAVLAEKLKKKDTFDYLFN